MAARVRLSFGIAQFVGKSTNSNQCSLVVFAGDLTLFHVISVRTCPRVQEVSGTFPGHGRAWPRQAHVADMASATSGTCPTPAMIGKYPQ